MPFDANDIAARFAALCNDLRSASSDDMQKACDIASDILSENPDSDLRDESLLDGIRWGHRAAHICEMHGGTLIRVRMPGASALTYEFRKTMDDARIGAAMAALRQALEDKPGAAS